MIRKFKKGKRKVINGFGYGKVRCGGVGCVCVGGWNILLRLHPPFFLTFSVVFWH